MVAEDGEPVDHELGVVVDELVVGEPEGVVDAGDALEMVDVAEGGYEFEADDGFHFAHAAGDGTLVVVAVAAEVVDDVEVVAVVEFVGGEFTGLRVEVPRAKGN